MIGLFVLAAFSANFETGNDLYAACNSGIGTIPRLECTIYIDGVTDGAQVTTAKKLICPAPGVTRGQVIDIVEDALRDHPETRQQMAALLVVKALATAFPCRTEGP
jgi:hypothetical protein